MDTRLPTKDGKYIKNYIKNFNRKKTTLKNIPYLTKNTSHVNNGNTDAQIVGGNNSLYNPNGSTFMQEIKTMMIDLTNQFANLQKQLQIQTSRID